MLQYNCVFGQSFSDVCLNTYGTMDNYVKMLNDNGINPNDIPVTAQPVIWDETIVTNQTIQQLTNQNNIIFATLLGFGIPQQQSPTMATYKETKATSYTATTDGESVITIIDLQGNEMVQIEREIKPLKDDEYIFNSLLGSITLLGDPLNTDETIFVIYKKRTAV
jgi:hypothetical protein